MPIVTYYPDGQVLTSTALSISGANLILQALIAQALGIIIPTVPVVCTGDTVTGSNVIANVSQGGAYPGCLIEGVGIPLGMGIAGVDGTTITILAPATATATEVALQILDPNAWQKVRIAWQQRGQPGFRFAENVATLRLTEQDQDYNRIRNLTSTANDGYSITDIYTYQRTWRCYLSFYGPNGFDSARMLKSALFLDWAREILAGWNLYPIPAFKATVRTPELIDGQWQERSDWDFLLNEGITETCVTPTVASVEVQAFVGSGGVSVELSDQTFNV